MVDFHGWELPVLYSSVIEEHKHVREAVGLFDVSHMGEVRFEGEGALEVANRLITNDLSAIEDGQAVYTPMCKPDGGIVDDLIAYRFSSRRVLFVINAANVEKDFAWIQENTRGATCAVDNVSDDYGQIAVQGPKAPELLGRLFGEAAEAAPFHHFELELEGRPVLFATTGYTGERGAELYTRAEDMAWLWRRLLDAGSDLGARPIGLGARDTLRLEYKFCLYGNDIDERTNPIEAMLGWTVKLDHDFIGREAIEQFKADKPGRKLVGFKLLERGIPRAGYPIVKEDGTELGVVTSGTMSPTLGEPIGLGYIRKPFNKKGKDIYIDIRGKRRHAVVCATPFVGR